MMYSKEALRAKRAKLSKAKQALLQKRLDGDVLPDMGKVEGIPRRDEAKNMPLSFAQQRLWLLHQIDEQSASYNEPQAVYLRGDVDLEALEQSFVEIVQRHEVLRTRFGMGKSGVVQRVFEDVPFEFPVDDLRRMADDVKEAMRSQIFVEETRRPFNLAEEFPWRARIIQLADDEYLIVLTLHHVACDGWSIGVFVQELVRLYIAFAQGQPSPLPPLPIQYADYATWQREQLRGEKLEKLLGYWREQVKDLPVLQLPTDKPRPPVQTLQGATQLIPLSAELSEKIKVFSRTYEVTEFMTLLAAFNCLLYRYTHQTDIVVGSLIAGRDRPELEPLIGFFVNNLVMRTDLSENPAFTDVVKRVGQVAMDAYAHQGLPFELLADEYPRDASRTPLFQTLFVWQNAPRNQINLPNLQVEPVFAHTGTAKFDLSVYMEAQQGQIVGMWEYNTDLFTDETVARMATHLTQILEAVLESPEMRIADIPMLTKTETAQFQLWHETARDFPTDQLFTRLFEERMNAWPMAVAVQHNGATWTYVELNEMANRMAHQLIDLGVGPDTVVGLWAERGIEFLVGILATFKAGGAYLPLDPSHPALRIAQVLAQSEPVVVVHQDSFAAKVAEATAGLEIRTAVFADLLNQEGALSSNPPQRQKPGHLAYVIFTSGSTGKPKGAMVEQQGMINHLFAKIDVLEMNRDDRLAQTASQCFDISVWQFLAPLLLGGQVHIFDDLVVRDPPVLLSKLVDGKITIMEVVPSLMRVMLDEVKRQQTLDWSHLRWQVPTGEALPPDLARDWFTYFPHVPLVNAYGPTECSDDVTHYVITEPPNPTVVNMPIGRPIPNMQIHILDQQMQPVPVGVTGSLWVGGVGVGRGYLNDEARTTAVFCDDPFQETGRFYNTGDLGRYLPDGNIEFLGRADFQVKIRGFRIELGEIEAQLVAFPAVKESVLLVQQGVQAYLSAYLVGEGEIDLEALNLHLRAHLPEYMIPSTFTILPEMPLTSNGKINRKALPIPEIAATRQTVYHPPRNEIEAKLVAIWERLLQTKPIGIQDNFFALNGHSLLAIQLVVEIESVFGYRVPIVAVFRDPTIAHIGTLLSQQVATTWQPLLLLREGTGQPLYCFNSQLFDVHQFRDLAQEWKHGPVYALTLPIEEDDRIDSIPALAERYARAIQAHQPEGPYVLCGHSFGGLVAYELARQFEAMGAEVRLTILDMVAPAYAPHHDSERFWQETIMTLQTHFGIRFDVPDRLDATKLLALLQQQSIIGQGINEAQIATLLAAQQAIHHATDRYPGQAKSSMLKIRLIRAADSRRDYVPNDIEALYELDDFGWGPWGTETTVMTTSGDHFSLLQPPHVTTLRDKIWYD